MKSAEAAVGGDLRIRPAGEGDLDALASLEAEAFPEPWSRRLLADELAHSASLVLVAEDAGAVAGYASFRRAADEAELLRVAVSQAARGRGTGRRLVEAGLRELASEGVASCFLEVRPGNAPALALYQRLGFLQTGRRGRYYADGSDALLLSRAVEPDLPSPPPNAPKRLDRSSGR